jgi:hypothetical protein
VEVLHEHHGACTFKPWWEYLHRQSKHVPIASRAWGEYIGQVVSVRQSRAPDWYRDVDATIGKRAAHATSGGIIRRISVAKTKVCTRLSSIKHTSLRCVTTFATLSIRASSRFSGRAGCRALRSGAPHPIPSARDCASECVLKVKLILRIVDLVSCCKHWL